MALAACLLAPAALVSCKKGPDISTPKKAALLFASAAQAGDMQTVRQVATGTDAEFSMVTDLGRMTQAFNRFAAAASGKFGADANVSDMSLDIASEFQSAEEKIDGDSALLIPKSGADESEPMRLKKDAKGWKLDLAFLDRDETARDKSLKMPAMAQVWEGAAREIEAGKFDTFPQARAAVKSRLRRTMLGEAAGKTETARNDLASLESALDQYKTDSGDFPSTADGLKALMEKPADALNWHGPYLKNAIFADPWGHPYLYVAPGVHNTSAYDLHSLGPDGKDLTPDDIDNYSADAAK